MPMVGHHTTGMNPGKGVNAPLAGAVLGSARAIPRQTGDAMKPLTAALAALTFAAPGTAQTPQTVHALGSHWGYFRYETGAALQGALTGHSGFLDAQPSAVITMMTRNDRPLTAADRADAARVVELLCETGGFQFNNHSRGAWLPGGGLSFDGDCTR